MLINCTIEFGFQLCMESYAPIISQSSTAGMTVLGKVQKIVQVHADPCSHVQIIPLSIFTFGFHKNGRQQ